MLSNANTLLSLYGYPPPDCLKLKHWSFSYIADLQAKKEKSLFSCKYFSFNSVFGKITWLNNGKGREKWGGFSPLIVRWEKIKTDGTCVVELCGCAKRPVNLR